MIEVVMYVRTYGTYMCNCSVLCYFCRMNLVAFHIKSIFYVSIFCTGFFVDSIQNINAVAGCITMYERYEKK